MDFIHPEDAAAFAAALTSVVNIASAPSTGVRGGSGASSDAPAAQWTARMLLKRKRADIAGTAAPDTAADSAHAYGDEGLGAGKFRRFRGRVLMRGKLLLLSADHEVGACHFASLAYYHQKFKTPHT